MAIDNAIEVSAIIVGAEETIKLLEKKSSDFREAIIRAIKESVLLVEGDCKKSMRGTGSPHKSSAPGQPPAVHTGKLRASITHKVEIGNIVEGKVGIRGGSLPDTKNYGYYLEYGTGKIAERPFLRPALNKNRGTIETKIKNAIRSEIK